MESEVGGVGCVGLCAGCDCGWDTVAVFLRRAVVGDIVERGGEGRGEVGEDSGASGGDEPECHSEEPVGPTDKAGPSFQQQQGARRGRHVASSG